MSEIVKGYKVFNPDWKCREKQYTCPGKFEEAVEPQVCDQGMHFCKVANDCFEYYSFNPANHVAEVIAYGEVVEDGNKCCTNKLEIVREIPWEEVLTIINTGAACTGRANSGNGNSGDWNSGDWNSGDWNSGDWNSGDWNSGNGNSGNGNSGNGNSGDGNSGNGNSGNRNSGNRNSGDWNSGDRNSGNGNSGNGNSGNGNSGDGNSGNRNSGNRNSGDWNSGDWNSGDRNSGNRNSGNRNSGNRNSGDGNSGDWNSGNRNSGCFCTIEPKIMMFNKPSSWTYEDWYYSDARRLLNQIPRNVVEWICARDMTDEEKEEYPFYETTGGYLKELDESECAQIWWDGLNDRQRDVITSLENFDAEIFEKCTGIKIGGDEE